MEQTHYVIAFDIDGTLLNDNKLVSDIDLATLKRLKKNNMLCIAATGRNIYSVQKVLSPDFPVDYVVFSSGAGIMHWASKKIIYATHITKTDIEKIIAVIKPYSLNYTVHLPIPNNHHMLLFDGHANSDDLLAYTAHYQKFVLPLALNQLPEIATQVIVLLNSHVHLFTEFKQQLSTLKTILTTSPINHQSMWMEVFNGQVSKSNGVAQIIKLHNIAHAHIFAIGNDYNDEDLLNNAHSAFVVENAPQALKSRFKVTNSNNHSGFTQAICSLNI